jgi:aryl-alcohol dehydrogenase-like predicted oxidoreductase
MNKRKLGNTDLLISNLALGGNVFGWTIDEKKSFEILDAFVAAGGNFIDTANYYSRWGSGKGGESETIIGNWMKQRGNRKDLIIATKVGHDMGEGKKGLSKNYILNAVEESLSRLKTDYIDLYQSHKDDASVSVEEPLEAYKELIEQGKVGFIGASNFTAARFNEALELSARHNLPRYESLQPHYNLCVRDIFEGELEDLCLKYNIGVISYFSLASGFLSGKYRSMADTDKSIRGAGVSKYMNEKGFSLLQVMDDLANKHQVATAAIAIAWLLARPAVTAPIASATSVEQLKELINGTKLQLSRDEITLLNHMSN